MLITFIYFTICIIFGLKFINILTTGYCTSYACLVGKTAVITGGNSGMGYECALSLASRGCKVIIADVVDSTDAVKTITESTNNDNIKYINLDLASFESVRTFSKHLLQQEQRLDILINNAGCAGFDTKTKDGIYKVTQVNYLGHFLLLHLLSPLLKQTKNSRVVFVSSILAFSNSLKQGKSINALPNIKYLIPKTWIAYSNSKAYILASLNIFAQRLKKNSVLVSACHPGIVNTGMLNTTVFNSQKFSSLSKILIAIGVSVVKLLGKNTMEGIQCTLHCALDSKVRPGDFIVDCCKFPLPWQLSPQLCQDVWKESLSLASITEQEEIL